MEDLEDVIPQFNDELQFIGDSSCVMAAKFTQLGRTGDLTIQFQDGSIYTYHRVYAFVWYNLLRALSKGEFFNRNIRNNYSFTSGSE